jgi:ribosome-binding protein aMBF1 (putative translation factor)
MSRYSKGHPDAELDPVVQFIMAFQAQRGWNQLQMARHLGIYPSVLSDWQSGWVRMRLETARRVLKVLSAELVIQTLDSDPDPDI